MQELKSYSESLSARYFVILFIFVEFLTSEDLQWNVSVT